MLYNGNAAQYLMGWVVNCFQFCNNFDVVQPVSLYVPSDARCELLSIL